MTLAATEILGRLGLRSSFTPSLRTNRGRVTRCNLLDSEDTIVATAESVGRHEALAAAITEYEKQNKLPQVTGD